MSYEALGAGKETREKSRNNKKEEEKMRALKGISKASKPFHATR